MDLPLYTTVSRGELSDIGSTVYHSFNKAVILDRIMRQSGEDQDQVLFRNILLRLRNGKTTVADWQELMKQTPHHVDISTFSSAIHLFPTVQSVAEYNMDKLRTTGRPIATIKAIHTGCNASKASSEEAGDLEPVVYLAHTARVMLIVNLWVEAGLVNGAMGTVISICYQSGGPPDLPLAVMVHFDNYAGPTLPDNTVPIVPIRRSWMNSGSHCSRLQIPLRLAWAVTIHKSQGLTMEKAVIDVGRKEFSSGLTYVACSRVRRLKDLLFAAPFPYARLLNLSKSTRLEERIQEDERLQQIHYLTILTVLVYKNIRKINIYNLYTTRLPLIYHHHKKEYRKTDVYRVCKNQLRHSFLILKYIFPIKKFQQHQSHQIKQLHHHLISSHQIK